MGLDQKGTAGSWLETPLIGYNTTILLFFTEANTHTHNMINAQPHTNNWVQNYKWLNSWAEFNIDNMKKYETKLTMHRGKWRNQWRVERYRGEGVIITNIIWLVVQQWDLALHVLIQHALHHHCWPFILWWYSIKPKSQPVGRHIFPSNAWEQTNRFIYSFIFPTNSFLQCSQRADGFLAD